MTNFFTAINYQNKASVFFVLFIAPLFTSCSLPWSNTSQDTPLSSSSSQPLIASGSTAIIDYRLSFSEKVIEEGMNTTIHVGKGEKIPAFDFELLGMKQGDKKTVLLHESMAYGTQNTEQIIKKLQITRSDVPGMEGWFRSEDIATGATTEWNNQTITIKQILNDEFVVITYPRQHPFAGKSITFEVEVKSVE